MQRVIYPQYKSWLIRFIIINNVLVFVAWQLALQEGWYPFMVNHFLVSWSAIEQGRWWVVISSTFSHNALFHLLINMFVLNSFGSVMVQALGQNKFIVFYFLAGISGSLAHAYLSAFLLGEPALPALGASGAIAGIILLFSLMFPREKILLLGIIPLAAIWGALVLIGVDLWGLIAQTRGGGLPIGHGAHLGGALIGIIYYLAHRLRN
jgi:membrane associated rhomboid family serine protease